MEAMLADLAEADAEEPDPGVFEEDEAAEILAVMIKEKKKTYTQSAQIKKDKELGRGYRRGGGVSSQRDRQGPLRPGTYKLSIAELKQRTRCKRCQKVGHWHKECTNPPVPGYRPDPKEAHLLEIDLDPYDDALFCHHLEAEQINDPLERSPDDEDILSVSTEPNGCGKGRESFDPKSRVSELDYMPDRVYEILYGGGSSYDDAACATIDTGCQRTAVGVETLNRMKPLWPPELVWYQQREQNKFRSVHGVSQTDYNAVIPCGLGTRGCYLKPAVFEGTHSRNAPFLLSLKFLLQSEAVISLRRGRLMLHLTRHGANFPLHIGPSGALRVVLNEFTSEMKRALLQAKKRLTGGNHGEFEILNVTARQLDFESSRPAPSSSPAASGQVSSHGLVVSDQQAGQGAAEPGAGERHLHHVAASRDQGDHVSSPSGPPRGPDLQQLPRCIRQPCPDEPDGAPAGDPVGPPGRCGQGPGGTQGPRLRALHPVPELEEGQADIVEQQPSGQLCGGAGGPRQGVSGLPRHAGVGVHSLQLSDRQPRTSTNNTIAVVPAPRTATSDAGEPPADDEPSDSQERNHDTGQPRCEHDLEQAVRNQPGEDQRREECHRHRQDGPAGDLHAGVPCLRAEHPVLRMPSGMQGGSECHHSESESGLIQLQRPRADETVRVLPVGGSPAASGRQPCGDPQTLDEGGRARADGPGASGQDPPGRLPAHGEDRIGIQCLRQEGTLPCMQQAADGRASQPDNEVSDGGRIREREGVLRPERVRGLPAVEEGPLLKERERKRLKGALRQADRQWKATFDLLQLTQPGANGEFLDFERKDVSKQLGQALNMSDRQLKLFKQDRTEINSDMAVLVLPSTVEQLLQRYRPAFKLQAKLLVVILPPECSCHDERFQQVLGQCMAHAEKSGQSVVGATCHDSQPTLLFTFANPIKARAGMWHVVSNCPKVLSHLRNWTPRPQDGIEGLVFSLRQSLAAQLQLPCQRLYVHDLAEQCDDQERRHECFAHVLSCTTSELEQHFTRRVRARTQRGGDERELRPDPPEGDGRDGEAERELRPDPPEGDGRDGEIPADPVQPDSPDGEADPGSQAGRELLPDPAEGDDREEIVLGAGVGLEKRDLPGTRRRTLRQLVRRAHDGLGHPHQERFLRILRAAKASDEVLKIAKELKCSVCARSSLRSNHLARRHHHEKSVSMRSLAWTPSGCPCWATRRRR